MRLKCIGDCFFISLRLPSATFFKSATLRTSISWINSLCLSVLLCIGFHGCLIAWFICGFWIDFMEIGNWVFGNWCIVLEVYLRFLALVLEIDVLYWKFGFGNWKLALVCIVDDANAQFVLFSLYCLLYIGYTGNCSVGFTQFVLD